jgi:hypothetical protein
MASASELAVNLLRLSSIGGVWLAALACSCATTAAWLGRRGVGAGRGLRAAPSLGLYRMLSVSESVSGGVTLIRGQVEPVYGRADVLGLGDGDGASWRDRDCVRSLALVLAAFVVAAAAAVASETRGLEATEVCDDCSINCGI